MQNTHSNPAKLLLVGLLVAAGGVLALVAENAEAQNLKTEAMANARRADVQKQIDDAKNAVLKARQARNAAAQRFSTARGRKPYVVLKNGRRIEGTAIKSISGIISITLANGQVQQVRPGQYLEAGGGPKPQILQQAEAALNVQKYDEAAKLFLQAEREVRGLDHGTTAAIGYAEALLGKGDAAGALAVVKGVLALVADNAEPEHPKRAENPGQPQNIQPQPASVGQDPFATLHPDLRQRFDKDRAAAIGAYGGAWGAAAEASVLRALRWFKNNQNDDGSWSHVDAKRERSKRAALTSLGILAFLAHGETPASEAYGETVMRAIRYVLACQDADGCFYSDWEKGSLMTVYEQAICVYAVSEAYGMTGIPAFKEAMDKGVAIIVNGIQRPNGGYDYLWKQEGRTDISIGAWCIQAMRAAWMAGCTVPELRDVMELELENMKTHQVESGHFKYSNSRSSFAYANMTAAGVVSLQLSGHAGDRAVTKGLKALAKEKCIWDHPQSWAMYGWYYITQAKFHEGGISWSKWNSMFAPEFIKHQMRDEDPKKDGAWRSAGSMTKDRIEYSGREDWDDDYTYATALATLSLTVYYRFPPAYKSVGKLPYRQATGAMQRR